MLISYHNIDECIYFLRITFHFVLLNVDYIFLFNAVDYIGLLYNETRFMYFTRSYALLFHPKCIPRN